MRNLKTLAAAALMLAAAIPAAHAEETAQPAYAFSGTLTMASDYILRGISQNDEHPALQGSFDYAHNNGLYAGVWGSNVDFNDGSAASLEADIYGGFKFASEGINWDIGGIAYIYPGSHSATEHYNYFEAKLAANRSFGPVDATAQFFYSPNFFADSGDAIYANLGGSAPVGDTGFKFTAAAGYQWVDNNMNYGVPDYADWSAGIAYSWEGFDFALKYVDTDLDKGDCADGCEARGLFTVSRAFK